MHIKNHIRPLVVTAILCAWLAGCIHRSPVQRFDSPTGPPGPAVLQLRDELIRDVEALAVGIGRRHFAHSPDSVFAAERWILERLREIGFDPQREEIPGTGGANVLATLPGTVEPNEIILIGAHYDSVVDSPGANDNASGVALLLAAARRLSTTPMDRTVRFVFFVNEEDPFTGGIQMGSRVHAERSRARDDEIVLMIGVDSVGYYRHEKGSQNYPPLVGALFPSTADFVVFATDKPHQSLLDRVVALFQQHSRFPTVGAATNAKQMNRGDHASFLWEDFPALALTDTSEFRNPNYHSPSDTPDTLDYDAMARMGDGFIDLLRTLANPSTILP